MTFIKSINTVINKKARFLKPNKSINKVKHSP